MQAYEACIDQYVVGTFSEASEVAKQWFNQALQGMPKTAQILEIGSATGRDAAYLQGLGYQVQCSDAAKGFVDVLRRRGLQARELNVLTDDIGKNYDLIMANGVVIHFTPEEAREVLRRVFRVLQPHGIFAFSVRIGEGGVWAEYKLAAPRFFQFWQPEAIEKLTIDAGFTKIKMAQVDGVVAADQWLFITAQK